MPPPPRWPKPPPPPNPPPAPKTGGVTGYFIGEALRKGELLIPKRMWRCLCEGCGAPVQVADFQCSYCLRATGAFPEKVYDVTRLCDPLPRFVK